MFLDQSAHAAITEYQRLSALNKRNLYSYSSGCWKSNKFIFITVKVPEGWGLVRTLSGL